MIVALKDWESVLKNYYFVFNDKNYDTVKWSILNDRVIQFSNQKEPVSSSVVFAGVRYIDINCAKLLIVLNNGDKYLAYKYANELDIYELCDIIKPRNPERRA